MQKKLAEFSIVCSVTKVVLCYLLNKRMATFTIVPYCQQIAEHSAPVILQSIHGRIPYSVFRKVFSPHIVSGQLITPSFRHVPTASVTVMVRVDKSWQKCIFWPRPTSSISGNSPGNKAYLLHITCRFFPSCGCNHCQYSLAYPRSDGQAELAWWLKHVTSWLYDEIRYVIQHA